MARPTGPVLLQGPRKRYEPVNGFEVVSEVGRAYVRQRNNKDGSWQKAAYLEEARSDRGLSGSFAPQLHTQHGCGSTAAR